MGIVLGLLCLICLCFLFGKAIVHKIGWEKGDAFFLQVHKYFCVAFIVLCCGHVLFVFPVLKTRHLGVCITGITITLLFLLIVAVYHKTRTNYRKMLYWHRFFAVLIIIGIVAHIVVYYLDFCAYQNKVSNILLQEIDTNSLEDGQYIGEYDVGYIYAKVRVTILQEQIEQIDILEHRNEKGTRAEKVAENITNTQDFPVDVISGATNSSKVIQGAIQNALGRGRISE